MIKNLASKDINPISAKEGEVMQLKSCISKYRRFLSETQESTYDRSI